MASYLVFRVIDTIEDSSAAIETKEKGFSDFLGLLLKKTSDEAEYDRLRDFLLSKISHTYERRLLENVKSVFGLYHGFGALERGVISKYAAEMARGMAEFQKRTITDFKAQDEYCYYVAGIVGYLNTSLFQIHGAIGEGLRDEIMGYSKNFGLALQKVNVLRDVAQDVPKGRHYWPAELLSKHGLTYGTLCAPENRASAVKVLDEVVANAVPFLYDALEYVTRLPRLEVRIRVFCLIPLFMALESFAKCAGNPDVFDSGRSVKISKGDVRLIVAKSYLFAMSNAAIRLWFKRCVPSLPGGRP